MEKRKIPFIDRLKDRGFVDQWGFVVFAFAGSIAIIAAKAFEAPATWVAIGAVLIIFAYAAIVSRSGSGRLRSDQAGDNCYYLGLIFTLASLAYAIFYFDPANTATTIVQGFGIALATTVTGLVLRVFFNQGRPDLEDYEERARISLTEAAAELRTQLGQVVREMSDFGRQVRQSINETRDAAANDISSFTRSSVEGLREVVDTANEAIRGEANDFAARSKRYTLAFDKLLTTLEDHTENVSKLSEAHEAMVSTVATIQQSATTAQDTVAQYAAQAEHSAAGVQAIRQGSEQVLATTEKLHAVMHNVEAGLTQFQLQVEQQLEAIRSAPGASILSASTAVTAAVERLDREIAQLGETHRATATGIALQAEASLGATRQHNEALEAALSHSRQLVEKVHTELAQMTSELARQVEARA